MFQRPYDGMSKTRRAYPKASPTTHSCMTPFYSKKSIHVVAPENLNSHWLIDGLRGRQAQVDLKHQIIDARPKPEMLRHVFRIFATRCEGPLFDVFYTQTFLGQAEDLYFCSGCSGDQEQQITIMRYACLPPPSSTIATRTYA